MRFTRVVLIVSLLALIIAPAALALRFTDESYTPPLGETGKAYPNWSFTGAGGCGPALPYQYRLLNSSAPPGLTIDSGGLVHGTPTQTGDFSFWLELSDENPPSAAWCRPSSAQRLFTIHVVPGLVIDQRQSSLGGAFLNQPYSLQLTAKGGGTQAWSAIPALPSGLTINSSTGLVSGTATISVPYGPGSSTLVEIVMNEGGGNPGTAWNYTATVFPNNATGGGAKPVFCSVPTS